jgi:hypothetical protein
MQSKIDELREKRMLLLYESVECKTEYVKTRLHAQIKAINIKLYKETKNPIYL